MGLRNPFGSIEREIKKALSKLGDEIKRGLNKTGDDIRRGFNKAGDEIKRGLHNAGSQVKDEIEGAANNARDEIEGVANNAKHGIDQGLEAIEAKAEDVFDEAVQALASAVTKEGLRVVRNVVRTAHQEMSQLAESKPQLVDEIDKLGGKIELGPVTLEYDGFYSHTNDLIGVLDSYISKPPKLRRSEIITMVKVLGPSSINLGISVQVVALVVGSKELGVGGGINSISIDLFAEIGDAILEEMGVPE